VWNLLVTETNYYAAANLPNPVNTPHPRYWKDVTVSNMKAFVGLLILMGVLHLPLLEMYWQQSNPYIAIKGISDVMTKTKFEQIYRFLHLTNNDDRDDNPENTNFSKSENWQTCCWLAFKGIMSHIKQLQLMKPWYHSKVTCPSSNTWRTNLLSGGIKVFVLSDATNGYVYCFQIYAGKGMNHTVEVELCSRVVLELMEGLEDDGFDLFTDNYYSSPQLFLTL